MKRISIFTFGLPILIFAGGCQNQFPTPKEGAPDAATPVDVLPAPQQEAKDDSTETALQVTAQTDKSSYKAGEPVEFIITLKNAGDKTQNVEFSSGQNFDVSVTPEAGEKPVWSWSAGRFFTLAIRNQILQPGEARSWKVKWDQQIQTSEGETSLAPRDIYTANAKVTIVGGMEAPSLKFTLTE